MRGLQLVIKNFLRLARRHKQITIEPFEFTLDRFVANDCFNFVDRRSVALRRQPRTPFSVQAFEFEIAIVESVDEMCCCPSSHPTADRTIVEDDD